MKSLLLALTFLPLSVFANQAPEMTWAIRPMVRAGAVLSVEDARKIYETTKETAVSFTDPNVLTDMVVGIGKSITHLSTLSEEEAALEIVNAIFKLSEVGENMKTNINAGAAASFVVFPTPVSALKDALALDDFSAFSQNLLKGMNLAQTIYQSNPQNDQPWYFLGAVGNIKVTSREQNEMHLQLVLGLKPRVIEQGANKIEIPAVENAADTPVALIDFTMPMDVTLPKIEMSFGKLGELQPVKSERVREGRTVVTKTEWRFRFEAAQGTRCERAGSTPRILQTMYGVTLQIPVYQAQIDGNEQRVTSADVRLRGPTFAPIMCWDVFGVVPKKFMDTVNKSITDTTFSDLLRLSLRELADRVQRLKQQANALP